MVAYSFQKRFVNPIRIGLGLALPGVPRIHQGGSFGPDGRDVIEYVPDPNPPRPKRQTIRAIGRRRHARPGENLQLYTAMRTKQCEKIGEATCISVNTIELQFIAWGSAVINGGKDAGDCFYDDRLNDFARLDGFSDWEEMKAFWRDEHGHDKFNGILIQWEPIDGKQ